MSSIGQIIAFYRKKKGLSQPALAEELDQYGFSLTNKAISRWEQDKSEPSVSIFMTLCKILDITDIYEEYYGINPANPLSLLNEAGKAKALDYINLLSESDKYRKSQEVVSFQRRMKLYQNCISAGTGNYLLSDDYKEVEVGSEVPTSADYGLRVVGNSMEPVYSDGQVVWVKKQDSLANGEIGIFYLNGEVYIKKLQDDSSGIFLISLNREYTPIAIKEDDSFKIFGRVEN